MAAKRPTILLIDDDENVYTNFNFSYGKEIKIIHAKNEREAKSKVKKGKIDLILFDLDLFGNGSYSSGLPLLNYLTTDYSEIPFIILSNANEEIIKNLSTAYDTHVYIKKNEYDVHEWRQKIDLFIPKKRILLIDDEPVLHNNFLFAFKNKFNIEISVNIEDAKLKLISSNFDVILLDIELKKRWSEQNYMEGFINLKQLLKNNNIPVIIISNAEPALHENDFKRSGAKEYLYKGKFIPNIWINTIITVLLNQPVKKRTNKKSMTICEQIQEAIEDNDFLDALELFKQKGVNGAEILRLKTKWNGIKKAFRKTEITREEYRKEETLFTDELIHLFKDVCSDENINNQQSKKIIQTQPKQPNMNHNNQRIEAINESLKRCVNKYGLHLKDFEAEGEALAYDGKEGMKKFNSKISDLEFELLSFTSGIPDGEKEVLIEEIKESRNPEKSTKERSAAKQKAIDLLKKYGPKVLEIGGKVALGLILRSIGLSLADIGLGD
jgi:CheY-like chemotaxis protein